MMTIGLLILGGLIGFIGGVVFAAGRLWRDL